MEEEDLEALLEEESRRKEQEDTQQVHQLLEENHTQRDGYSTESVGVQEEDDELEALLEQELQQKEAEDQQSQLPVATSSSKATSVSNDTRTVTNVAPSSVDATVFQVEERPVKPYFTKAESAWREDFEQPPLALQWTQEEFDLFCQQVVRLGPSALEQPWLIAKAIESKNALECLLLYEALRHQEYQVKLVLHPNKFVVEKSSFPVKRKKKSEPETAPIWTWERFIRQYQSLVTRKVERGFPTPPELRCYEPWSVGFWLRLSVKERRLLALSDWHILLSFCNTLRSSTCPPVLGSDPRVFVRILAYTCDYMRYITRVALSFAISESNYPSSLSVQVHMHHISKAIDIANEYYRYRANHRFYLGSEWLRESTQEYPSSYHVLTERPDEAYALDPYYEVVLLDYGWLNGSKQYVCVPTSLEAFPLTDLYFLEEWWHPHRRPTYRDLCNHLLARNVVEDWISLWLGQGKVSEAEWKQSYEYCSYPLSIAQDKNCHVSSSCRQWICNAGCYYLAYQCRYLMKCISLNRKFFPVTATIMPPMKGIYFDYFHWHMLQMHMEQSAWS